MKDMITSHQLVIVQTYADMKMGTGFSKQTAYSTRIHLGEVQATPG